MTTLASAEPAETETSIASEHVSDVSQPPAPTRPRFPSVVPAFARRANAIAGVHRTFRFDWSGQPAELIFSALPEAVAARWSGTVALGERQLSVCFERLPQPAQLSAELAGIELHDLPSELACGVVEACFEPLLDQLKRAGIDLSLELIASEERVDVPAESLTWTLQHSSPDKTLRGAVWGDHESLDALAALLGRRMPERGASCQTVPFSVSLVASRIALPLAAVRALETGDVIFPEPNEYRAGGFCEIWTSGRQIALGTVNARLVTITRMSAPPDSTAPVPNGTSTPADELPVQLQFIVGETTLTVRDLQTLQAGFTFELPASAGAAVTIRANGQHFGTGELVEVGERLGVRLTDIGRP